MTPSEAISTLLAAGLTEVAIGDAVGARQSTINKIKSGGMQPNYTLGKALVDLALSTGAGDVHRPGAANDGGAAETDGTSTALKDAA